MGKSWSPQTPLTLALSPGGERGSRACFCGRGARVSCSALCDGPVDDADDQDHRKRRLEERETSDWSKVGEVRQAAYRRVLVADREVSRPQEVDLHRDAPDQPEDVDDQSPLAELERRRLLWPTVASCRQDR